MARHEFTIGSMDGYSAVLILPVVTWIAAKIGALSTIMVGIAGNLVVLPLLTLLAGLAILVVVEIVKSALRNK